MSDTPITVMEAGEFWKLIAPIFEVEELAGSVTGFTLLLKHDRMVFTADMVDAEPLVLERPLTPKELVPIGSMQPKGLIGELCWVAKVGRIVECHYTTYVDTEAAKPFLAFVTNLEKK